MTSRQRRKARRREHVVPVWMRNAISRRQVESIAEESGSTVADVVHGLRVILAPMERAT